MEFYVFHHGLKGFFGFVLITDEEKKDFLLIKIISIVVNFLLETVGVKLFELFLFIDDGQRGDFLLLQKLDSFREGGFLSDGFRITGHDVIDG